MGWNKIIGKLVDRWNAETPRIFKFIQTTSFSISAIAVAINSACMGAGAIMPIWWGTIFPYLVGIGALVTTLAQLTKKKDESKI